MPKKSKQKSKRRRRLLRQQRRLWTLRYAGTHSGDNPAINLLPNPWAETDTASWTTGGTNVLSRVVNATEGIGNVGLPAGVVNSFKIVYKDNAVQLLSSNLTLGAVNHMFSGYAYIPSTYDGTDVDLSGQSWAGSSGGAEGSFDMGITDAWRRVNLASALLIDGGDLIGNYRINEDGDAPTVDRAIYFTALMVETGVVTGNAWTDFIP